MIRVDCFKNMFSESMLCDDTDSTVQKQGSKKMIEGHAMLTHDWLNE